MTFIESAIAFILGSTKFRTSHRALFWLLGKFQLLYVKYEILKKINQPSDHTVSDASLRVEYRADIYLSLEYNLIKLENSSSWQLAIETTDIKVGTDAAVSIPTAKF